MNGFALAVLKDINFEIPQTNYDDLVQLLFYLYIFVTVQLQYEWRYDG